MTSWVKTPAVGDSVLVYDNGATAALTDDGWTRFQIKTVTQVTTNVANGCPVATGLTQAGDISAANPSYQLTFVSAAPATIAVGAGIRFFRRVHYRIYKETDNQWYIGFFDCIVGRVPVCITTQPIAGPFQAYAVNGTSGMQFAYYDSLGAVTAAPLQVARISLLVPGPAAARTHLSGAGGAVFDHSARSAAG